jgi:hypothetical protein
MNQASRLVKMDSAVITKADLTTLTVEDFDIQTDVKPEKKIGFLGSSEA